MKIFLSTSVRHGLSSNPNQIYIEFDVGNNPEMPDYRELVVLIDKHTTVDRLEEHFMGIIAALRNEEGQRRKARYEELPRAV